MLEAKTKVYGVRLVKRNFSKIENMKNPFNEDSADLLALDTKEMVTKCVLEVISGAKMRGQSIHDEYVEERVSKRPNPYHRYYTAIQLTIVWHPKKRQSLHVRQGTISKVTANTFPGCTLYIACQAREGNLEEFLKYENSLSPPALSFHGKIRTESGACRIR